MNPSLLRRLPARHRWRVFGAGATAVLTVAACGSDSSGSIAAASGRPAPSETAGPADNGAGEGSPIRFVSSRNHYQVDFPAAMTEASDGSATATRATEKLIIQVVSGAAAGDLAGFATADLQSVLSHLPGYTEVAPLATTALGGRVVHKVVYLSTNGTNPVTGNPETLVTARYYIPRDTTVLAVLTYSIAENQYDPQGADDVAMTFQWQ